MSKFLCLPSGGAEQKIEFDLLLEEKEISSKRQILKTAFIYITSLLPRTIKACTEQGFLVKIFCLILAYSASFLCNSPLMAVLNDVWVAIRT